MRRNLILETDSYKISHPAMLPDDITRTSHALEARLPTRDDDPYRKVLWNGLQPILRQLEGQAVTYDDVVEAKDVLGGHLGPRAFAHVQESWEYLVRAYGGRLPLRIWAAPEGSVIPRGNVLMVVDTTDRKLRWLGGHLETKLMKVWYPTVVGTVCWYLKAEFLGWLDRTGCPPAEADYMLHDFGYRGVSSEESAGIGGGAHLTCFYGTDTIAGLRHVREFYGEPMAAVSVPATEHFVMTVDGDKGEQRAALRVIARHEGTPLSIVADSYDYYKMLDFLLSDEVTSLAQHQRIKLVVRPDSITPTHTTPAQLVVYSLRRIEGRLGAKTTPTGHKVLPIKVLWGDGLEPAEIGIILKTAADAGYAASNLIFGMGGGLLQKVNRDTLRFAMKATAVMREGEWRSVRKRPLDASKASPGGLLRLVQTDNGYATLQADDDMDRGDLDLVFDHGMVCRPTTLNTIRHRVAESHKLLHCVV